MPQSVSDFASVLWIPGSAATLAAMMYAGCAAAESVANPKALRDIGEVLRNTSWSGTVHPSTGIPRLFQLTFGARHLSLRSMVASLLFTMAVVTALSLPHRAKYLQHDVQEGPPDHGPVPFAIIVILTIIIAILPDYVSLAKTRILLRHAASSSARKMLVIAIADFAPSFALSVAAITIFASIFMILYRNGYFPGPVAHEPDASILNSTPRLVLWVASEFVRGIWDTITGRGVSFPVGLVWSCSTVFTAVWTTTVLLAVVTLKLLIPLQRFTTWFFDVETHPIKAIGIVSGALLIAGGIVWTVIKAVV